MCPIGTLPYYRSPILSESFVRTLPYRLHRQMTMVGRRKIFQNERALPGTPDFYIPSMKLAIFTHGCFWHCCPTHFQLPSTNVSYWIPKLEGNVRRDARARRALNRKGISVWYVWEHDLKPSRLDETMRRLGNRLHRRISACC